MKTVQFSATLPAGRARTMLKERRPFAMARLLAPDNPALQESLLQASRALKGSGEVFPPEAAQFREAIATGDLKDAGLGTLERLTGIPQNRIWWTRRLAVYLANIDPEQARSIVDLLLDKITVLEPKYSIQLLHASRQLCYAHHRATPEVRGIIESALVEHGFSGYNITLIRLGGGNLVSMTITNTLEAALAAVVSGGVLLAMYPNLRQSFSAFASQLVEKISQIPIWQKSLLLTGIGVGAWAMYQGFCWMRERFGLYELVADRNAAGSEPMKQVARVTE